MAGYRIKIEYGNFSGRVNKGKANRFLLKNGLFQIALGYAQGLRNNPSSGFLPAGVLPETRFAANSSSMLSR
jgi:hypothetical protein